MNTAACTLVMKTMVGMSDHDWTCQHIDYLIHKSQLPGSGIVETLSCNLSSFYWGLIIKKPDFNSRILKTLISLGAKISKSTVSSMVVALDNTNVETLDAALHHLPVSQDIIHSFCMQSLKLEKTNFFDCLVQHGAQHGAKLEAQKLLQCYKSETVGENKLFDIVSASKVHLTKLLKDCLIENNDRTLKLCKQQLIRVGKYEVDLLSLIRAFNCNDNKEYSFTFYEWLLKENITSVSYENSASTFYEAIRQFPKHTKPDFYYLMLKLDVNIHISTLKATEKADILENITLSALKKSKPNLTSYFITDYCHLLHRR